METGSNQPHAESFLEKERERIEAMESIAERLSLMEDLYFPRALQPTAINPSQRKLILTDLLSRDAAVFLGNHSSIFAISSIVAFF